MSKRRREHRARIERAAQPISPFESGVIPKGISGEPEASYDFVPPWDVVQAYLASGRHRDWVEGWAARSPSFRDVIDALRNDHLETEPVAPPRRNVVSIKRAR